MRRLWTIGFMLMMLMGVVTCIDPYVLPDKNAGQGILVVDAFLNFDKDTLGVKLSYSKLLNAKTAGVVATGATVSLTDELGNSVAVGERPKKGSYYVSNLALNSNRKYQLRIKTVDKKEYVSEFVSSLNAPPIDSAVWKVTQDGVDIIVNSHDPGKGVDYYRWEFEETYEYTSNNPSYYSYNKPTGEIKYRFEADQIYHCWKTEYSKDISIRSTANLARSAIENYVLVHVPSTSKKLAFKYSIFVKQYALDKKSFSYWQNLKKTSESLGTLFDPQPAELTGNVSCVSHPGEQVLGYFGAGTITTQRVSFVESQLRPTSVLWRPIFNYTTCNFTKWVSEQSIRSFLNQNANLLILAGETIDDVPGYNVATDACVDCRLAAEKGTTVKPPFWP